LEWREVSLDQGGLTGGWVGSGDHFWVSKMIKGFIWAACLSEGESGKKGTARGQENKRWQRIRNDYSA